MPSTATEEVLGLNRKLLATIAAGDWPAYRELVAPDITCFEPEAKGHLVEGLPFHEFYFKLAGDSAKPATPATMTIATPVVKMLADDVALVAYVRLVQKLDAAGSPITVASEETRIWKRYAAGWKHVHFHRSLPS
jgi:calcium/calmodulin-dependent protein kinase (CaM kinase) II